MAGLVKKRTRKTITYIQKRSNFFFQSQHTLLLVFIKFSWLRHTQDVLQHRCLLHSCSMAVDSCHFRLIGGHAARWTNANSTVK